jgi:hypothetical protein
LAQVIDRFAEGHRRKLVAHGNLLAEQKGELLKATDVQNCGTPITHRNSQIFGSADSVAVKDLEKSRVGDFNSWAPIRLREAQCSFARRSGGR